MDRTRSTACPASPRYAAALRFAHRAHAGQYRKGSTIPYIGHPLAVGGLALQYGADDDVAIAALLHDTVEDAGGRPTLERIRWAFGERVAAIVDACTDAYGSPKPAWPARKERYVARLRSCDRGVKLVVACDKLDNLRATNDDMRVGGVAALAKFNAPPEQLRWYYTECARAVADAVPVALAERLGRELRAFEAQLAA